MDGEEKAVISVGLPKKKKLQLFVLAFLLSFLVQFIYIQSDFNKVLEKKDVLSANITSLEYMVAEDGVYTGTENVASIFFESDGYFVTEILFQLSQSYGYERGWLLYYATDGQEFQLKDALNYTTEVEETWIKFTIPTDQYDTFRLDIFYPQDAPLHLEHIFLSQEPITALDELCSKVSFLGVVGFTILIYMTALVILRDVPKSKEYAAFFVMFLFYAYYFPHKPLSGDAIGMFTTQSEGISLFAFCVYRYENWSSRLVIEGFLYYLIHSNVLWGVMTALLCVLTCFSISRLTSRRSPTINWVIVALFLLYPMGTMVEAGWMATTTNYLWVLAFGIFSLLCVKDCMDGKAISGKQMLLYCFATVYGANQEQGAALLLGFYLLFFCYFKFIKIPTKSLVPPLTITIISLLFHLTCPGNSIRSEITKTVEFPEFDQLSMLTKLEMAYTSTLYEFIMKSNGIFVLFCVIFFLLALEKKDKKSICYFSVPLFFYCLFNYLSGISYLPWISEVKEGMTETGTNPNFSDFVSLLPIILVTTAFVCLLYGIFLIFEDKMLGLFNVVILLGGMASRLVMGLSPSIWISGSRTFIFLYFCFIISAVYGYVALDKTNNKNYLKLVHILLVICVVEGFLKIY